MRVEILNLWAHIFLNTFDVPYVRLSEDHTDIGLVVYIHVFFLSTESMLFFVSVFFENEDRWKNTKITIFFNLCLFYIIAYFFLQMMQIKGMMKLTYLQPWPVNLGSSTYVSKFSIIRVLNSVVQWFDSIKIPFVYTFQYTKN